MNLNPEPRMFWKRKKTGTKAPMPKLKNRGSLWKLVQCVTLLTSCKDARLLKTAAKITGLCQRILGDSGRVGLTKKKKTTLTKKLH